MYEELRMKVRDIKTVCMDRLDSTTADGNNLNDLFNSIDETLTAAIAIELQNKEVKKK